MKKHFTAIISMVMLLLFLSGCAKAGGKAAFEDYTGNAPNGALGTIKLLMDNPDHKGVKVTLTLSGFGEIQNVKNNKDAEQVSEALVKYASLYNEDGDFRGAQYYYIYFTKEFKPGKACKLELYYLVPPESANDTLCFKFDYPDGGILIDEPCNLF
ncbi:MAG: hypothetical protein LBN26_09985 [Christensenellaceae bacterium]|jgi:hypothetical protein|nr:hypothetical protein [Christensenellaceae bacterium]